MKRIFRGLIMTPALLSMASVATAQTRQLPSRVIPAQPVQVQRQVPQATPTLPNSPDQVQAPQDEVYFPTFCSGASHCNDFIANCIGEGGDFTGMVYDEIGQPIGGMCTGI
ncbi:MAG: hypothetical protein F6J95_000220 [Leptolyngbya sp. SIO1E4]|nr:hypothetical protein [Leptolyngbya sp. SIO1E4]